MRGTLSCGEAEAMNKPRYWLCFWDGNQSRIEPAKALSREAAIREGLEFSLDHLTAVFSQECGFSHAEMVELSAVLPPLGSHHWRSPEEP